jgi:hypothetical protein
VDESCDQSNKSSNFLTKQIAVIISTRNFFRAVLCLNFKFNAFPNCSEVNEDIIKYLSHIIKLEHISSVGRAFGL